MDCGNPEVTLQTNAQMLQFKQEEGEELVDPTAVIQNSTIVPPCYIGKGVQIRNSTIGPGVSVGAETIIENCELKNVLIQNQSHLTNIKSDKAMIGNHVRYKGNPTFVSLGDYSELQ
jgi:glucose-1-phosphate thymidylyltransferase